MITSIVLSIMIVLNLFMQMDAFKKMELELNGNKLFAISEKSKNMLKGLDSEVSLMGRYEEREEDDITSYMRRILEKYKDILGKIKV